MILITNASIENELIGKQWLLISLSLKLNGVQCAPSIALGIAEGLYLGISSNERKLWVICKNTSASFTIAFDKTEDM